MAGGWCNCLRCPHTRNQFLWRRDSGLPPGRGAPPERPPTRAFFPADSSAHLTSIARGLPPGSRTRAPRLARAFVGRKPASARDRQSPHARPPRGFHCGTAPDVSKSWNRLLGSRTLNDQHRVIAEGNAAQLEIARSAPTLRARRRHEACGVGPASLPFGEGHGAMFWSVECCSAVRLAIGDVVPAGGSPRCSPAATPVRPCAHHS